MSVFQGTLLAILVSFSTTSLADNTGINKSVHFNIPQQRAVLALTQFAEQANLTLVFPFDVVKERRANRLVGEYSIKDGVEVLLLETGLTPRFSKKLVLNITADERSKLRREEMNVRKRMGLGGLLASIFAATGATAQSVDSGVRDESLILEEIVVTAQKRGAESLLKVPVSMSVLSGEYLDASTYQGIGEELSKLAGVSVYKIGSSGESLITIRGVASATATFNGGSTVGYYLDDLPFGLVKSAISPDASAFDMERVEVLRGPQGTLYGASALNGVVRILTKDANLDDFGFKARTSFSSTDEGSGNYRGDMVINAPLIPGKLAARLVVGYNDMSGWINKPSASDVNDGQFQNYRLKVNAQPTEELSLKASVWDSRSKFGSSSDTTADYVNINDVDEPTATDFTATNLAISYDFSQFTFTSATSHMDYKNHSFILLTSGSDVLDTTFNGEVRTQEFGLTSRLNGSWQWSLGGMYREASEHLVQKLPIIWGNDRIIDFTDKSKSSAVFAEIVKSFLDDSVDLTLGLRSFEDKVSNDENSRFSTPVGENLYSTKTTFDKTSPRVVLTWYANDDLTIYGSYAQGFRSGFEQHVITRTAAPEFPPVSADSLNSYEVGAKGRMLGGRLNYDMALYYIDWKDPQQPLGILFDNVFVSAPVNGESVSGPGIDFGLTARASERFQLDMSFSWNDLTMDSDVSSGQLVLFSKGERTSRSAEYTGSLSMDYVYPLGSSGFEGRFSGSVNYVSELQTRALSRGVVRPSESDRLTTGQLSFSISAPMHWITTFYVDNVTNEDGAAATSSTARNGFSRMRPRTIGLQLEYRL